MLYLQQKKTSKSGQNLIYSAKKPRGLVDVEVTFDGQLPVWPEFAFGSLGVQAPSLWSPCVLCAVYLFLQQLASRATFAVS